MKSSARRIKKNVYAIIATYNGTKWIKKCLESLLQSSVSVQVIVVDNASTDGTPDIIETDYPEVNVIRLKKNTGFGAANNIGIKEALKKGADYLFLLNMDASVEKHSLEILIQIAEQHSSYGIISPMHLNGSGDALDFLFSTYLDPRKCPGLLSDIYLGNTNNVYTIFRVNAACWLMRAEVINRVGYFDELFFMYGEDDNLADRVTYHGYDIGVAPGSRIFHDREQRANKKPDAQSNTKIQMNRAKVIALDPNQSPFAKWMLLLRKSFSYMLMNFQCGNISAIFGNWKILIAGTICILRFDKKYKTRK